MVCLGNICRSPLAEGIMRDKVRRHGLNWAVDSAGTGNWHIGEKPDSRSMAVARKHGLDISDQRARQFHAGDLEDFDLILAMDGSNLRNIRNLDGRQRHREKTHLIMELAYPGAGTDVPDPYWDDNGFEQVYHMLDDACEQIISLLQKHAAHTTK